MRILTITNYYPPLELGGWEQLTAEIVTHLRRRGHEIVVLTSSHRADEVRTAEPGIFRDLYLQSPDVTYYHPDYSWRRIFWNARNLRILRRAINDFQPHIIFINGMWNLSPAIAVEAEKMCPGRVIYYMASTWPTDGDPDRAYWSAPPARRAFGPFKAMVGRIANMLPENGGGAVNPEFPRVLCVSEYIRRHMIHEGGIPAKQTHVVYNGIDHASFSPDAELSVLSSPVRLLYAGSLVSHKGVDTAVRSLVPFREGDRPAQVQLTIVGSGHPNYEAYLRQLVDELGLTDMVTFEPRISRDQMPELLKQHDVLIFPSTWEEPLARMVQEAMASGMVVIGSTSGGTPEILCDGENGLSFTPSDHQMLADKISLLLDDPELAPRLSRAARRTIEERFTIDRMVDELEEHFRYVTDAHEESYV